MHGIRVRQGKLKPNNHEACSYCQLKGFVCAFFHEGAPDFIAILPLPASLRQARNCDDVEF